jgi:hypothetical protein
MTLPRHASHAREVTGATPNNRNWPLHAYSSGAALAYRVADPHDPTRWMGDDVPTDGPAANLDACFAPLARRHDLRRGCRSVGMALDPSRAALAQRRTKSHGVDQPGYPRVALSLLLLMPVTGYLQSADGRPVSYLGLFNLPQLPKDKALGDVANVFHHLGQWGLYTLVGLHVGATVWHVAIRRDGLLNRMIPPQNQSGSFGDAQ